MDSVEKIKYFYETIISENQIGKVAEFSNWNSMKFQNPRYINKMGDKE